MDEYKITGDNIVITKLSGGNPSPGPTGPTGPVIPPVVIPPNQGDLGNVVDFPWPTSGQDKRTIHAGYGKTTLRTICPANLDLSKHGPNNTGFDRLAETPGYTTLNRTITVRVNGVIKFGPQDLGSAPQLTFTVGNPDGYKALGASWNLQPGDERLFTVDNVGLENTPYTEAAFNHDMMLPRP